MLLKLISCLLPWPLRRLALQKWFGYSIHPSARIGLSWIFPGKLVMEEKAAIGHFCVAIHLDNIHMKKQAAIGRNNWITGFTTAPGGPHFAHQPDRRAELILHESASVTKNHHIDCTSPIEIGAFSTIAGYQSQLLTHSIDLAENRQHSAPIHIGAYTFVGTNVVILGGARLPDYSVLAAKSLLNKSFSDEWTVYGGVPAKPLAAISRDAKYFTRTNGFVY